MMYSENLLPSLEALARRATEAEGLHLAWIELKRQGGSWVFRVFIEGDDGTAGLADCERVTHRLGLLLDVEDPIDSSYILEVSSPGLDRPLHDEKDYARFAGRLARVKTKELLEGRKRFSGRLRGIRDGKVALEENGTMLEIPLSIIESGHLEVEIGPPRRDNRRASGRSSHLRKPV